MKRRHLIGLGLLGLVAGLVGAAFLYFVEPTPGSIYPRCTFHVLTGLLCPGCGMTRALHHLVHGEFIAALRCNLMLFLVAPLVLYAIAWAVWHLWQGKPIPTVIVRPFWSWLLVGFIIAFFLLRNLPWYPFTLLAPGP